MPPRARPQRTPRFVCGGYFNSEWSAVCSVTNYSPHTAPRTSDNRARRLLFLRPFQRSKTLLQTDVQRDSTCFARERTNECDDSKHSIGRPVPERRRVQYYCTILLLSFVRQRVGFFKHAGNFMRVITRALCVAQFSSSAQIDPTKKPCNDRAGGRRFTARGLGAVLSNCLSPLKGASLPCPLLERVYSSGIPEYRRGGDGVL